MARLDSSERIQIESAAQLRVWLEEHHSQDESVWLVTFKRSVPDAFVSVPEILDELLCFGWIDGVRRKLDEDRTMQLISPRRTQYWAKSYKDRAARLIAEGRMKRPGLQAIEAAKQSGLWDFMDDVDALIAPDDLVEALAKHPSAAKNFASLPPSYRRNALRWLKLAKTRETRIKRLEQIAALAAENQRVRNL